MADDEELDYVSTSPFLTPPPETKQQDELDMPKLKKVQAVLQSQIDLYSDISTFDVAEQLFTVKEQLAINQMVVAHLKEVQSMIKTTLSDIKEKYSG